MRDLFRRGGIDTPPVMGSRSVHVMTGVGGGPLRAGDLLPVGDAAVRQPRRGTADATRERS